ncbi:MAG: arylesterase [Cyclobacteriaceae bacterium]|nr:arylesterase [Cyclobacteriaceae bacterium]
MVHFLLIIGISLSAILIPGYSRLQHPNDATSTILCFGNSLTAGYNIDPTFAYPAVLERNLKKSGYDVEVINAGLSGETSAGGLERINWILRQPVDIFILELGANDGLRGLPLEQTKNNLQAIIDRVKSKYPDVEIVIAGMMVPPNMGEKYGSQFVKIYPELATKNDARLIPFLLEGVGGDPVLNMPDGIHPNVEGHKIVADNVLEVIRPLL